MGQSYRRDVQAVGRRQKNYNWISFTGKDSSSKSPRLLCAPFGLLLDCNRFSLTGFIANEVMKLRKPYSDSKPKNMLIVPSPRYFHFMGGCLIFTAIPNRGVFQCQGNYLIKFLTCCVPGDAPPNMLF